ncbi:MAG: shikimate dehydrogenase [Rubrobacter sp.]
MLAPETKHATVSGTTRLLAVLGHPISHSLSPAMHNASFAATGQDYLYVPLDVTLEDLPEAVRGLAVCGFRGFNVTMPHKEAMVGLVDELDLVAEVSGAVNTVVIPPEGEPLIGMNTDGGGFIEAASEAGISFAGRAVAVVGAGGAAAAISCAVLESGCEKIRIVNRSPERARRLAERLVSHFPDREIRVFGADEIPAALDGVRVAVNTTYLGMKGGDEFPIPQECLEPELAVCDAVYRRDRSTELVRLAREAGALVMEGGRMLLYQGVLAQRAWTGVEPDVAVMSAALRAKRTS